MWHEQVYFPGGKSNITLLISQVEVKSKTNRGQIAIVKKSYKLYTAVGRQADTV